MLTLIIGLLLVNTHNIWEPSWTLIITLIGWIALIKGTAIFIFPDQFLKFAENYSKNDKLVTYQLCLTLAFGLFLTFKGYF